MLKSKIWFKIFRDEKIVEGLGLPFEMGKSNYCEMRLKAEWKAAEKPIIRHLSTKLFCAARLQRKLKKLKKFMKMSKNKLRCDVFYIWCLLKTSNFKNRTLNIKNT